ncbi:glycerophosphodiester phosphodiesterase [soil metagenome]
MVASMPGPHPLILAHRGASASARENTLAAFRLAVVHNADGIELDVRRTADDVLVIHHDSEVAGLGPIVQMRLEELRRDATWIPTLDEALDVTGDLLLDIEVKSDPGEPDHDPDQGMAERVAAWVDRHRLHDRTVVTSFDPGAVAAVRAHRPAVATGLLVEVFEPVEVAIALAATEGHRWVLPHHSSLREQAVAVIAAAHREQIAVVAWTVDDAELMRSLAAAGIDGIITNDPAAAHEVLAG